MKTKYKIHIFKSAIVFILFLTNVQARFNSRSYVYDDDPDPVVLLDDERTIEIWRGLEIESDEDFVKSGSVSARWESVSTGGRATCMNVISDWSPYNYLKFWVYSGVANNATILVQILSPGDNGEGDYFHHRFKLGWRGWRQVKIELPAMGASRTPAGWDKISGIVFHSFWGDFNFKSDTVFYFDLVTLEGKRKSEEELAGMGVNKMEVDTSKIPKWNGKLKFVSYPWDEMIKFSETNTEVEQLFSSMVTVARNSSSGGKVIKRPQHINEAAGLYDPLKLKSSGAKLETAALAYCDADLANLIFTKFVNMAIAYRYSKDKDIGIFLLAQIEEIVNNWRPLQRPGWTQYTLGSELPSDWKGDGVWLATGWGLVGLVTILNAMGDAIPQNLDAKIRDFLRNEVALIVETWDKKIAWYVQAKQYNSNQWVFPLLGLVYACLYLEDENLRSAYNLGIDGIAKTCMSQGNDGSWTEGPAYAMMSMDPLARAVLFMKLCGDDRLANLPLFKNFSKYYTMIQMPGKRLVNAFDGSGFTGEGSKAFPGYVTSIVLSDDTTGLWMVERIFRDIPTDVDGIIFRYYTMNTPKSSYQKPPLYAFFPDSQIFTWRTDWNNSSAMGLWIRGSSMKDLHSHRDQGHISIYNGKNPILVEAGGAPYGTAGIEENFCEQKGHNILQTFGMKERGIHCHAPITVKNVNDNGGTILVNGKEGYTDVEKWDRTVSWEKTGIVTIEDTVVLNGGDVCEGDEWFRFHTGSKNTLSIAKNTTGDGKSWGVKWDAAQIELNAKEPVHVEQVDWPNAAFGKVKCILIKAVKPGNTMNLKTVIRVPRNALIKDDFDIDLLPSYDSYSTTFGKIKSSENQKHSVIEAENMIGEGSGVRTSDTKKGALIATTGWENYGSVMEGNFETDEGIYIIVLKYCTAQTAKRNFMIDKKAPFKEAVSFMFETTFGPSPSDGFANKANDWKFKTFGIGKKEYKIYLTQGRHRLSIFHEGGSLNLDYILIIPDEADRQKIINEIESKISQ